MPKRPQRDKYKEERNSWARQSGQQYGNRPEGICSHVEGSALLPVGYLILAMARTSLG